MDAFLQLLTDWGYAGMFISAFLAGTILPFSSEAVLLACVGLGLDPVWSTISTTAGNALGGITCYWIGHLGKIEWIENHRIRLDACQCMDCSPVNDYREISTLCHPRSGNVRSL